MNCKPGDVAEYIGMHQQYRGYYVKVLKPAPSKVIDRSSVKGGLWEISPPFGSGKDGKPFIYAADCALRPLPPDLLKDEIPTEEPRKETI